MCEMGGMDTADNTFACVAHMLHIVPHVSGRFIGVTNYAKPSHAPGQLICSLSSNFHFGLR